MYNIDTQEQVAVHMCGFDRIQRGKDFGGEPIGRPKVEVKVGKLKNGKAAGKDEITGEMIKGGGDRVLDWIWRQYSFAFESGVVSEDWRSVVIVPLYKGKGDYIGISLSVIGKIYGGILVERVCRVTVGLIEDEQGGFRAGSWCVDQIFTLKQVREKV